MERDSFKRGPSCDTTVTRTIAGGGGHAVIEKDSEHIALHVGLSTKSIIHWVVRRTTP